MANFHIWDAGRAEALSVAGTDLFAIGVTGPALKKLQASTLKTYMSASPTLVTPVLGVAVATSINGLTITANGTNTLNIAAGKSLTVSNTLTLAGTDSSTLNISAGGTLGRDAFNSTRFNVMSYGSSAVDGTTDNHDRFLAAATAASAAGGGTVYAPQQTVSYVLGQKFTTPDYVNLGGAGMVATTIKRKSTYTGDLLWTGAYSTISDLTVDGNWPNRATGAGAGAEISMTGQSSLLDRVQIVNPAYIGVTFSSAAIDCTIDNSVLLGNNSATGGGASVGIWAGDHLIFRPTVRNTLVRYWTVGGIYGGATGMLVDGCYLIGNHVQTSPTGGGQIAAGDALGDMTIIGGYIGASGGALASGLEVDNCPWTVIGTTIVGQQYYGIFLQGGTGHKFSNVTVSGSGNGDFVSIISASAWTGVNNTPIAANSVQSLPLFSLRDTSAAFDLTVGATSSTPLSAGRALTIDVVNAARTLKLTGNPTLADWFDQSVKTTASPTFNAVTVTSVNKVTITQPAASATLTIPDGVTLNAGAGGTLGSNAFNSTAYLPLAGGTLAGDLLFNGVSAGSATLPALSLFVGNTTQYELVTQSAGLITRTLAGSATDIGFKHIPKGAGAFTVYENDGSTVVIGAVANPTNGVYLRYATTDNFFAVYSSAANAKAAGTTGRQVYIGGNLIAADSTGVIGFSSAAATSILDVAMSRAAAANLQLGAVTGAGAAVAQTLSVQGSSLNSGTPALFTIAGSDQTGTGTTGGNLKIRGGNGVTVGGAVEIWTSATTTPAVALSIAANKNATFAGNVEISKAVAAGTQNNLLILRNNTAGASDLRVGIQFQPSNAAAQYGPTIYAINDGVTGDGHLVFGTYANDVLVEKARITYDGKVGIGTTAPDKALEVNLGTASALRLTYNDANGSATNYTDFTVSSVGSLTVAPVGTNPSITLTPGGTGGLIVGAGTSFKNIRHGITGALVAGVLTVTDAGATANTRYFFTAHTLGTVAIPSTYYVSARSAGVSFTITASVLTDTSTLNYLAVEP